MSDFRAIHISLTHIIKLNAPLKEIFLLFTPQGEKKWAPGWDFETVYPASGETVENQVFTTLSQDHAQSKAIWLLTRLEPENHLVEYVRVEPELKIGKVIVSCKQGVENTSLAEVSYIYTALSEKGNEELAKFTEDFYKQYIGMWENAINHYLETGEILEE